MSLRAHIKDTSVAFSLQNALENPHQILTVVFAIPTRFPKIPVGYRPKAASL
jgi:hypothetical protein